MPETTKRVLLSCLAIAVTACLCLSAVSIALSAYLVISDSATGGADNAPPADSSSTEETAPGNDSEPAAIEVEIQLSEEVLAQMAEIEQEVLAFRGLELDLELERVIYTPEQLRERVVTDFFGDYTQEEAGNDAIVLWAFGLVERGIDLLDIYIELYSESVVGFYDSETGEMVVVQGQTFGGYEHLIYAHEFIHALQDSNYGLIEGLRYNDEDCENESERCAALQALIEGDATHSELQWFRDHSDEQEREDIFSAFDDFDESSLDFAPAFLEQDLSFPYTQGQVFVESLYDDNEWEGVHGAYLNPPVSTEQILHPERYPNDEPILVNLPDIGAALGSNWELLDEDVMGEWYTYLILAFGSDEDARLNETEAQTAAEGWGGDAFRVYHNPQTDEIVMVIRYVWDAPNDLEEFAAAFEEYATARFGQPAASGSAQIVWVDGDTHTSLNIDNTSTTWIFAPDEEIAEAIWDSFTSR